MKPLPVVLFFVFSFVLLIFSFFWYRSFDSKAESISIASGRLPVSLTMLGRSTDSISARLTLFNTEGDPIASLERSWVGWELVIDCIVIGTQVGWVVFPFSLYSDETSPRGGSDILRLYNQSGFPSLWEVHSLDTVQRKFLKQLFFIIKTERWMPSFLGSLYHEQVTIRSFETGLEYGLYISNEGTLFLKGY